MKVVGMEELMRALANVPANLSTKKNIVAKSLRAAGQPILEEQKTSAPDDPDTAESRIEENLGIAVIDQTAISAEARVGSKKWGFVGRFAEHGTSHQTATPWMGPAFDRREQEALSILSKTLAEGIEDAYR